VRSGLTILAIAAALAALAIAPASAHAPGKPHVLALEYYEDLEDGPRYNVTATIKGDAEVVNAVYGSHKYSGRLSHQISPTGPGKSWLFRQRSFVKKLRADLNADGFASVIVTAAGAGGGVIKACSLSLQPDPVYGDYAGGECKRD